MRARIPAVALALVAAALATGCGSTGATGPGPASPGPAPEAPLGGAAFLATSLVTPAGTWAVTVMGGSVASHNNFWQLFVRPSGTSRWELVTPPGVPDNGGLVVAASGQSFTAAFRPSQYLTYTPLTLTRDAGRAWSSAGPLDAALADWPGALALAPSGRLLALLTSGTATTAAPPSYGTWTTLITRRALAATPAGRRCGLRSLTAAAFGPSGLPLLAGGCSRPGTAGIFAVRHGTWQLAGPAIPTALAGQDITVMSLISAKGQVVALLAAGSGNAASLTVAWSAGTSGGWSLSPPLPLRGASPASVSSGPGGTLAVTLPGRRGDIFTAGHQWRSLPLLPEGTATLVAGPGRAIDALAVHRSIMTIWQTVPGAAGWTRTQTIRVPIQYGSSG